jgi:hypothetical protein
MKLFSLFRKKPVPSVQAPRPVVLRVGQTAKAHIEAEVAEAALLAMVKHYETNGPDDEWAANASWLMNRVVATLHRLKETA